MPLATEVLPHVLSRKTSQLTRYTRSWPSTHSSMFVWFFIVTGIIRRLRQSVDKAHGRPACTCANRFVGLAPIGGDLAARFFPLFMSCQPQHCCEQMCCA